MKKRSILITASLCVICFFLWRFWPSLEKKLSSEAAVAVPTNTLPVPDKPQQVEQAPHSPPSAKNEIISQDKQTANSNAYHQWLIQSQVPLDFYGKVIDENSNTIAGAKVGFAWSKDDPTTLIANEQNTHATQSEADGQFSLHGARGRILGVTVSKEGYYTPRPGTWSFRYSPEPRFSPDPLNPVIFQLRKKGTPEILTALKRNYGIPRDGTSVAINLVSGQSSSNENGDIVVQCWTQDAGKPSGAKYDWRCLVTIPHGGLLLTNEEFAFLAPESGYSASTEIAMPGDNPKWSSDVDLKFYYHLADGRYGRMTFSMIAGGHHFCMIDSVLNPTGSRNLEPAN